MTMREAKKEAHRIAAELIHDLIDNDTWKDRIDSDITDSAEIYRVRMALTALAESHERHAP